MTKRSFGMESIEASKRVYTVAEIQDMLGIGKNQAYSLIKRQEFPVRKCGKKLLIPKVGVDARLSSEETVET